MATKRNKSPQPKAARTKRESKSGTHLPPPGTTVSSPDDEPMVVHPDLDTERGRDASDDLDDDLDEGAPKGVER